MAAALMTAQGTMERPPQAAEGGYVLLGGTC